MTGTKRPLIGITSIAKDDKDWGHLAPGLWTDCLFRDYTTSILAAGGIPLAIPLIEDTGIIAALIDRLDGVLLSGGPDLLPSLYGEEMRPGMGYANRAADQMEIEITRLAFNAGKPVFGVCRGIQVMAVATGGTLYQDIGRQVDNPLMHAQKSPKNNMAHTVTVTAGSKLAAIVQTQSLWVNSHHHQSIKDVPEGFAVTARANDGVVEAIEHATHPFFLGVQWHPEGTAAFDKPSGRLFSAFVEAAT